MPRPLPVGLCACLLATSTRTAADKKPSPAQIEFFEKKIRPVLVKQCYSCHSAKAKILRGGLRLDNRQAVARGGETGPAVLPGKPAESLLLQALKYDGLEMPPSGKLPKSVIADFETWIRQGAPDPRTEVIKARPKKQINYPEALKFWSFTPPRKSPLPKLSDESDVQNEIDRFVLARLETAGLKAAPAADRPTLIRRVTFGLTGLPPTPEEVEAFVNDDQPGAFGRVVDRLLQSRHYGERWARHWLDVARYAEDQAHTFKARRYPHGHRYRDWVVRSLNADMPYDEFIRNQVAADLVGDASDRHDRLAALGFFAMGPVYYQDNGEKAKALADEWDDRVDTLTRGLLGVTVSCARCHDHKYDPFTVEDYYGLAGIFSSSQYRESPIVSQQIVSKKQKADQAVKDQQLVIDRYLDEQARLLRPSLIDRIPDYVVGGWVLHNRRITNGKDKKLVEKVAKELKLSQELIKRWEKYLFNRKRGAKRPHLAAWFDLLKGQDQKKNLSGDKAQRQAVKAAGEEIAEAVKARMPRHEELFARFGADVAFVKANDKARVRPGHIPLGNLFDDKSGTSLESAIGSDRFKSVASADSLGVDRIAAGWGNVAQISPGVRFHFIHIGSSSNKYGQIVNDGWNTDGGIRTIGKRSRSNLGRTEQGIGMHANALITFDLDEIRKAGLLPADQAFLFKVDRAGLNDDSFGTGVASVHTAVVLSRPHSKPEVYDAIIAGYVNGRKQKVEENDKQYYFAGPLPPPLKGDGKYASFDVPVPPEAKFLTLVTTGADHPADNPINSDHSVFSGARLEMTPVPEAILARARKAKGRKSGDKTTEKQDRADAVLLSEHLFDQGLLALPAGDAAGILPKPAAAGLKKRRDRFAVLKKAADEIQIHVAHTLVDSGGKDLQIYRAGDPTSLGAVAPRSFPAILPAGKRTAFQPTGSGRLELARSLTAPDNPLTARVSGNRVWAGHFGFGLVRTPSNFGALGERPTHPGLLDWLAVGLVENKWSLKWLHRTILLSSTYARAADFNEKNFSVDGDNRLLWRMNRRRLEVEPWRDAMLAVSGNLDLTFGGPSKNLDDANNRRRTLYGFVSRHKLNELLRLFDFPDPNITSDRRTSTTVPLQQLFVLNSGFMNKQAQALVKRLEKDVPDGGSERIRQAYRLLFARGPSASEVTIGEEFLKEVAASSEKNDKLSPWLQYALALLGSNEFTYID